MGDFSWGMVMIIAIVWTVAVAIIVIVLGEKWIKLRGQEQTSLATIEHRLDDIQLSLESLQHEQRVRLDEIHHVQAQLELRQRAGLPPESATASPN